MGKLRVGVIGAGGIANAHARGYKENLDKCELAVVCNVREDAAKAYAERHGFAEVMEVATTRRKISLDWTKLPDALEGKA